MADSAGLSPIARALRRLVGKRVPEAEEIAAEHQRRQEEIRRRGEALRAEIERAAEAAGERRRAK